VTLLWLIVWFIADQVGGREPLLFNPDQRLDGNPILAIALDLGGSHARGGAKRERPRRRAE
jgi:hypothetical protein